MSRRQTFWQFSNEKLFRKVLLRDAINPQREALRVFQERAFLLMVMLMISGSLSLSFAASEPARDYGKCVTESENKQESMDVRLSRPQKGGASSYTLTLFQRTHVVVSGTGEKRRDVEKRQYAPLTCHVVSGTASAELYFCKGLISGEGPISLAIETKVAGGPSRLIFKGLKTKANGRINRQGDRQARAVVVEEWGANFNCQQLDQVITEIYRRPSSGGATYTRPSKNKKYLDSELGLVPEDEFSDEESQDEYPEEGIYEQDPDYDFSNEESLPGRSTSEGQLL